MRTVPLFLILLLAAPAVADEKARALVEKAIQAQGGPDKVAKLRAMRIKVEGTMDLIPGQPATAFVIEDVWHMPDKYRTTSTFAVMGMKVTQTQVLDGARAWSEVNGQVMDLPKEAAAEMREQQYAEDLDRFAFLKDRDKELSVVEDAQVNGKPAAGVLIKSKGHRDVTLYFDKGTGLLVKRAHPILDPASGKEAGKLVLQEVVFADYADTAGVKHYKTVTAFRGGKKVIDAKVTLVEFLDRVDPKLFTRPRTK